jgi:DNA invertase Pin-like site-specific DNA recombinase
MSATVIEPGQDVRQLHSGWRRSYSEGVTYFLLLPPDVRPLSYEREGQMKEKQKKAIGYIRFSTDDQAEGSSIERQTANIESYCARHSLELVEVLIDEGFSAYSGEHLTKGKLGRFLAEADKGKYRGYALVLEHMDRLSREGPVKNWRLSDRILSDGIVIHVTQQDRAVESLDDLQTAIMQTVDSFTAREYSKKLSERVGSAWRSKKRNTPDGIAISKWMPAWLTGKAGEPIQVNEKRAKIVREIFRLAASGHGKRMIARILNERGIPPFRGETWGHSYIGKLLHSRAPLGEWQPCDKDGKPDGEPHPNHFPQIVDAALYQKARAAIVSRRTITDNGAVTGKYAGRTGSMRNLFSGLVWDASAGFDAAVPMHYTDPGKGAKPRLSTEKTGPDRPHWIDYGRFENAFLAFLDDLNWREILGERESADLKVCDEEHARITLEIEGMERQAQNILDSMAAAPSKLAGERLQKLEAQIEQKKTEREAAEQRLADLQQKSRDLLDSSVAFVKLSEATDLETRSRLREGIRRKVSGIYFLTFNHRSPKGHVFTGALVRFKNGSERFIMLQPNKTIVAWLHEKGGPPKAWLKGQPQRKSAKPKAA